MKQLHGFRLEDPYTLRIFHDLDACALVERRGARAVHHEQAHGVALPIAGGPVQRRVALRICYADVLHQAQSFGVT